MSEEVECISRVRELTFRSHGDSRGQLIALEGESAEIPFAIKRCYYIFDTTPNVARGFHAHKNLQQVLICTSGACTIDCELGDGTRSSFLLNWPTKGLLIEGLVWREMRDFSKDAVLMVLASAHYDERDYIRNYEDFRRISANEHIHS